MRVGPGLGVLVAVCCPVGPTLLGDVATVLSPTGTATATAAATASPAATRRRRRMPCARPRTAARSIGWSSPTSRARSWSALLSRSFSWSLIAPPPGASGELGWSWTRDRSAASARLAWDFTVPTEMPSTSAVSASLSSS